MSQHMHLVWVTWFCSFVLLFILLESYAVVTGGDTLSRSIWELQTAFPMFGPLFGIVIGVLLCHFWWGGLIAFKPVGKLMTLVIGR